MNSSEILKSINSIDDRVFNDQVCKIDRLMRLYKMSKANDLSLAN